LKTPITANQVSILGVVASLAGAVAMVRAAEQPWLWMLGALCIQLRLLSNMMDGLVAVEGGRGAPTGPLFNELPDRLEDSLLLIAAAYGAGLPWLGWLAALLAALTAYVRAVGASLGHGQDFRGPMAKPHRMAALTLGALLSAGVAFADVDFPVMQAMLGLIIIGTIFTLWRRTSTIANRLKRDAA
jgi:phosphatidylglycerophosphate synthase